VNVAAMLLDVAERHDTGEAFVGGPVRLDYAGVARHAGAVSAGLARLVVEPGERVAILLPNGWHYAVCYFGVQLAGAVAVLVNTRLTGTEIEHVLRDSGARLVLTDDVLGGRLVAGSVARCGAADLVAGRTESGALPGTARQPGDIAQLLYTSGTTGRPKGAMQTHANLLANAGTVRDRLGAAPGERTLIVAPMFHATGIASQLVGFCSAGACCVLVPRFHAETMPSLLVQERITVFAGVAAMLRLMFLRAGAAELSALRLCVLGGAPVPTTFPAEVRHRIPDLVLANVWGLTEATSIVTYVEGEEYLARPWSVGRAVPGVELAVSVAGKPPRDVRDQVGEQRVRAVVVPRPGAVPTAEALRSHAATLLADFKVPAEFRFVEALPRNPSGKVLKRRLASDD
jgi:fatty-acyl-CoA synthase